jgi:hypothetical protein
MIPDWALCWLIVLSIVVFVGVLVFWGIVSQLRDAIDSVQSKAYALETDARYERARAENYMQATERLSSSAAPITPLMDHLGLKWVPASQSPGRIEKKK